MPSADHCVAQDRVTSNNPGDQQRFEIVNGYDAWRLRGAQSILRQGRVRFRRAASARLWGRHPG